MVGCDKDKEDSDKKIVVGTNAEFAPFEYINDDGEIDGFDIALMKAICKDIGYEVEFRNMEFKSLTASLKTKALDAVIAGMTITDERKQSVDFSKSYYNASQSIIVSTDSEISSLYDLNGARIAVQEGTTGDLLVTVSDDNEIITDKNTVVKRFKKGSDAVLELNNGGVDAVVIDSSPAEKFVSINSEKLKIVKDETSMEEYGIAVSKGNTKLVNKINKGLDNVIEDGTFDELVDRYIAGEEIDKNTENSSFIDRVNNAFIKTNGYKLLLKGLWTTIYIALGAIIIGVILGTIVALMKMTEVSHGKKTILSRLASIYISVLRGTPIVVQLLIVYMIIFKSNYGIIAAVITFGINSGAYVAEIIRSGIMAVDKGQMEGGLSLGFNYAQTMRYIIAPQAIKNALPALGNEFISLIKETSIVGYVAIQDLTKAADFIISRTYDTFLPLIAIAIVYFIIIIILTKLLQLMERRLRQSDIR